MSRRAIYYGAVGVAAAAAAGGWLYLRSSGQPTYQLATVERGPIVQQVLASGNVESPTSVNLNFQSSGRLVALNVAVNQKVSAGEVVARQDTSVLQAQLAQAQAATDAAQAALAKLQTGATPQSVAVSQAALNVAQQSLHNSYATVQNTLADAYAKANDAVMSEIAPFFSNGQANIPQLTFHISDSQLLYDIISQRSSAGAELANWQGENMTVGSSSDTAQLDLALSQADSHLAAAQSLLTMAVEAVANNIDLSAANVLAYRADASVGLTETNAAISEIRALQQSIASEKASLAQAQAQLNLTTATSSANDIAAAQAQVAQAQANVAAIEAQIRQLEIVAPTAGVVAATGGVVGEIVTPSVAVVSIIPQSALQVKANVSEDNIVGVHVGEPALIELDAFPSGTTFSGTVSDIDPAETVVGGAIYYHTKILFDKQYPGIKPGMTANISIETGSSTDALIVPASAVEVEGANTFVRLYRSGSVTQQRVTVGLRSQKGTVQIVSGLSAGDQIVTSQ